LGAGPARRAPRQWPRSGGLPKQARRLGHREAGRHARPGQPAHPVRVVLVHRQHGALRPGGKLRAAGLVAEHEELELRAARGRRLRQPSGIAQGQQRLRKSTSNARLLRPQLREHQALEGAMRAVAQVDGLRGEPAGGVVRGQQDVAQLRRPAPARLGAVRVRVRVGAQDDLAGGAQGVGAGAACSAALAGGAAHLVRNTRSPDSSYALSRPPRTRMVVSNTFALYDLRVRRAPQGRPVRCQPGNGRAREGPRKRAMAAPAAQRPTTLRLRAGRPRLVCMFGFGSGAG